ncbi:MAG: GNAT family N-acetyltransferase [Endozoicomonas sp.]
MEELTLFGSIRVRVLETAEFERLVEPLRPDVFKDILRFRAYEALDESEKFVLEPLFESFGEQWRLNLAIYDEERLIGWSWGRQEAPDRFCMVNSGLIGEYRGKGIYTALLPLILDRLREKGFQVVSSRHTATNNAVLIPKLRAGFVITGMELSDTFGTLVCLSYFFNPLRRKALDFRSGQERLDAELAPLLDLHPQGRV